MDVSQPTVNCHEQQNSGQGIEQDRDAGQPDHPGDSSSAPVAHVITSLSRDLTAAFQVRLMVDTVENRSVPRDPKIPLDYSEITS